MSENPQTITIRLPQAAVGTLISKFLLTVDINSVPIEMEIDSGAECSAIPLSVFEQQLADVCELQQSSVSLF